MEIPAAGDTGFLIAAQQYNNTSKQAQVVTAANSNNGHSFSDAMDFERLYIACREKEGRLYTDEQLRQLPAIDARHVHYSEWQIRKRSATRLFSYLRKKNRPLSILETGCGNGWLCHMLSTIKDVQITGSDINTTELSQAKRVFGSCANIRFVQEVPGVPHVESGPFDIIVFAASIQYFAGFEETINRSLQLLHAGGEIHIMDTHFYTRSETAAAKDRSHHHYQAEGHAALASFYFHHTIDDLKRFQHTWLYNPAGIRHALFGRGTSFPWIRIVNK